MTSRKFGQFFDPTTPIVTLFITETLVLLHPMLDPSPPKESYVIYGQPLSTYTDLM
jgi:hypothetical protein